MNVVNVNQMKKQIKLPCKLTYFATLDPIYQQNYLNKLKSVNIEDPYEGKGFQENIQLWPEICYFDIFNYLVIATNSVTQQQMKSFKSLEAHNFFTSGWVHNKILVKKISSEKTILQGQVSHSQSLNAARLKVWVAAKSTGEVLTAHCTCMAGKGEACSHIGALLFAVETGVRLRNESTCTDKMNVWLRPNCSNATNKKIKDLDFGSSNMKRKKMFPTPKQASIENKRKHSIPPTEEEVTKFFKNIAECSPQSAILSILPEHCKIFEKDSAILKSLYNSQAVGIQYSDLLEYCKTLFHDGHLKITDEKALKIEENTRNQTKSKQWFDYRAGRITASVMKAACHTKISNPSASLINRICYPSSMKFSTVATVWGCSHEETALKLYIEKMQSHSAFNCEKCGFHINPKFPHIGATPDGKTSCKCCGKGIVEVKCPYCAKSSNIVDYTEKKSSCLKIDELGNTTLIRDHPYFYQVQTQIFVCNVDFCDFVVWTENDSHIERIYPDEMFWEDVEDNATTFFIHVIMPEIIAEWYTKQNK